MNPHISRVARRMAGAFAIAISVSATATFASPAAAHPHIVFYDRYPATELTVPWRFDFSRNPPSEARIMTIRAYHTWNNVVSSAMKFEYLGDGLLAWQDPFDCGSTLTAYTESRVGYMHLASGAYGETRRCVYADPAGNRVMHGFRVYMGSQHSWSYQLDVFPETGQGDYLGVVTHELGHATGFAGHFDEPRDPFNPDFAYPELCDGSLQHHTMCSGGSGNAGWHRLRTLEAHDVDTFTAAYPTGAPPFAIGS